MQRPKPNLVMKTADASRKLVLFGIAICSLSVSVVDLPAEDSCIPVR